MRFSTSLAIVALLGLGNLPPSARGAPTGLSERRLPLDALHDLVSRVDIVIPHEDPDPVIEPEPRPAPPPPPPPAAKGPGVVTAPKDVPAPILKIYPPKDVPNPFEVGRYDYAKSVRSTPDPNWGTVTDVSTPNYEGGHLPVDVIAINTDKNSIGIMEAWNKDDAPADTTKKLALADIEMNLFTQAGKTPQDLSLIHVDNVKNTDTRNAITSVYKMNNKPTLNAADITVRASAATGSTELNGFNTLLGTPFGIGADKVRQQFSVGKSITSFKVSNHKDASGNNVAGQFDMDITFA
ncbi:uncharacterized protein BP5553_09055 [Venustampulla echinocandica]|uniref:Uncharacterized protein n=1 Tax=Venustampulla echinocandica TaxID=2656787 RepID=A0A370TDQ4_9HELO|nr:uncharacterized protein BP5553_09055 [Venustampulla echinocandica]RDL32599.1 hypothetical protein BP5553_09055 [Venustampulla echinocandica]